MDTTLKRTCKQVGAGLCILLLYALVPQQLAAQTFYELVFTDKEGYENHGLMMYTDEDNCHLRLARHRGQTDDFTMQALDYLTEASEEDDSNYTVMACAEDDTPIFIWMWNEEETAAQQLTPFVCLHEEDDIDDWVRATDFYEVKLRDLTPNYVNQFYSQDETIYQQICAAHAETLLTEQEVIKGLGDGTDIFLVMYEAVMNARGKEPDMQWAATTARNDLAKRCGKEVTDQTKPTQTNNASTTSSNTAGTVNNITSTANQQCSVSSKPVIHLFVVANTKVADIGEACATDYRNISNEIKGISQSLGLQLKEYTVSDNNYSKEAINRQLDRLTPGSNDIVFFLYTGHGFRFENQQDPFPMMALTTNDYQPLEGNYVALSDMYNAICSKNARLNIVLSDCCNSNIGERRPVQGNTLFTRGNNNFSRKRLAELFYNAKGTILSTASSPGEYSWCDAAGGMFTLSFIQALRKEISAMNTSDVSWQTIMNSTLSSALQRSKNNAEAQNGLKKMSLVKL